MGLEKSVTLIQFIGLFRRIAQHHQTRITMHEHTNPQVAEAARKELEQLRKDVLEALGLEDCKHSGYDR